MELDDAGCATLFLGIAVGHGIERRGAALHCGLHGEGGTERHAVGVAGLRLFAVVVVRFLLGALAFVLADLFEGENDVCGVGIIDDGELSPAFEAFKRTGFYGIIMGVIDDSNCPR